MSDIRAYDPAGIPALRLAPHANAISQRAMPGIAVEVADGARLAHIRAAWIDLLARADTPNVFMDPALVRLAAEIDPSAQHRALLAWKRIDGQQKLVGVWALSVRRVRKSVLPMRVVTVPPYAHAYLATPVIDRDCLDETLDAMLDSIADEPQLPHFVACDALATEGETYAALMRVLANRGTAPCIFERFNRPKLQSELDGKSYLEQALSSGSRKKLRQYRRRLSEKGALATTVASIPDEVRREFETFLTIEAAGWKGRQGTALLCNDSHAAFARRAVGILADFGCASIHTLSLDGKPVSMQIALRSGAAAFTWKTAYDEQFRDFSPGMLLLEDYTAAFLADKSIAYVDSCSLDDAGYMSAWTERQSVADLWIDARRGGSLEFRALGRLQRTYRDLRMAAKSAFLTLRKSRQR